MAEPGNFFDQFDDPDAVRSMNARTDRTEASANASNVNAAEGAAKLPFVAPSAAADLTKTTTGNQFDPGEYSLKEMEAFERLKPVQTYVGSLSYLDAALRTKATPGDDNELVTLAAKLQDPTGSVMQGDIERYNNIQVALERLPEKFRNEFLRTGQFSDQTRRDIRGYLIRRVNAYQKTYDHERKRFKARIERANARGDVKINPLDVVGEHPAGVIAPTLQWYADSLTPKKGESDTVGLLDTPPEGTQIGGEPITGYRFNDEAALKAYLTSPGATPEGFADLAAQQLAATGMQPSQEWVAGMRAEGERVLGALAGGAEFGDFDYSGVDEAAQKNATPGEVISQGLKNIPESAAQLIQGFTALPVDAGLSLYNQKPQGSTEGLRAIGADMLGMEDNGAAAGFVDSLIEPYTSVEGFKQSVATDPLRIPTDLASLVAPAASAARKAPGMLGPVMRDTAAGLRNVNPARLTNLAARYGVQLPGAVMDELPGGLKQGAADLGREVLGAPSGVGGDTLLHAYEAGKTRAPFTPQTPQSRAFTQNMRNPEAHIGEAVEAARAGLKELREQASTAYQQQIASLGVNPVPLDINVVRARMQAIKPKNFDAMIDAPRRPSAHTAWEAMNDTVEHYALQAQQNSKLLEPLQMDQFKQDLYDIGSKVGGAFDKDAARIAREAYNGVKNEIIKHDSTYATTMKNYENAAREMQQLETSFGLKTARGKDINIDAATRRLQSVLRNNANTNYGQRAGQADRLAELDPSGTLMPSLAGQSASSWRPRGLQSAAGIGASGTAAFLGAPLTPMIMAAPTFMPRVAGELAHGLGRTAAGVEKVLELGKRGANAVADFNDINPSLAGGWAQMGSRLQESGEDQAQREREELAARYGIVMPSAFGG